VHIRGVDTKTCYTWYNESAYNRDPARSSNVILEISV
jgi:hypothetical protein